MNAVTTSGLDKYILGHSKMLQRIGLLRAIDASLNRAGEGLRVVEDYVRFVLGDRHLTDLCKQMRHELNSVVACIPSSERIAARDAQVDVGLLLTTSDQLERADAHDVLVANFKRLQQSLRSLEEYAKVLAPRLAAQLEPLRYRAYTLERAVEITSHSRARLAEARLYVLIDGGAGREEFAGRAGLLVEAGAHLIQLREKRLGDRELLERARLLRRLTADSGTLFIMNDRPDLAVLAAADGVHLGQEELSVKDARRLVGTDALIGVSTHSMDDARRAVLEGANYIGVGPVFASSTKTFTKFPGIDFVRAVHSEISLPAFAIGGIGQQNLPQVLATGITRIAVSGAIASAKDPATAVRELLSLMS